MALGTRSIAAWSVCMVTLGAVSAAEAAAGKPLYWAFQTVSQTSDFSQSAVAMRDGQSWPVVITDGAASGGYGRSYSLFPVVNPQSASPGSYWWDIGSGFYYASPVHMKTASSPDGRVAFAASNASMSGTGIGGRISSVSGGWTGIGSDANVVAFSSSGALYTANGTSVAGMTPLCVSAPIVDIAVSKSGVVGVLTADDKYWQYGGWQSQWS